MNRGLMLPPNYTIRPARNRLDRWGVYRLLILEREQENSHSILATIVTHPYTLLVLASLIFMISFAFILPLQDWFYLFHTSVLIIFAYVIFLQLGFLYNLFVENKRRLVIALYREQVIGFAMMAFRGNYSVVLGLYVAPSHRHRGVGSHLIQYLLQRDALPIYLSAPPDLHSFYARFGFVETNRRKGYNMVIRALK